MCDDIKRFGQPEYNRVLNSHSARRRGLGQTGCQELLIDHGATFGQAKNGAYVFLHHHGDEEATKSGSQEQYERLLSAFGAKARAPRDCVNYLESQGYSYGQAKSAVYQYRSRHGLIGG